MLPQLNASASTDYQAPCSSFSPAASRAACEVMNTPHKRARHMSRMERCLFRPASMHVWQVGTSTDLARLNDRRYVDGGRVNGGSGTVTLDVCEVEEPGGLWIFTRIGPFETRGGNSWSRLLATFNDSLTDSYKDSEGNLLVGDHILGNTAADGSILPHPPIHQHHYHVVYGSNIWRQALNVHGDSECYGNQREFCLLREYPEDIAIYSRQKLGLWADFNDVRPANSTPLTYAGCRFQPTDHTTHTQPDSAVRTAFKGASAPSMTLELTLDAFAPQLVRLRWTPTCTPDPL